MKRAIIMIIAVFLLTACGEKKVDLTDSSIPIKERVSSIIHDVAGEKTDKLDTVKSVKISDGFLMVEINSDANAGSKNDLLNKSAKIFADLSKTKEVKSALIKWYATLTDQYGNSSMGEVLSILIDGETFKKVNWSNYQSIDLEKIASGYTEHRGFEQK